MNQFLGHKIPFLKNTTLLDSNNELRYYRQVIRSFVCKETERLFNREFSKKLPQNIQRIALRKLWMIHAAPNLEALKNPPANHLEKLKNDRQGYYSIRINDQWRICFLWDEGNAYQVEIVDYH